MSTLNHDIDTEVRIPQESSSSTVVPAEKHSKNIYGHMEWAGAFGDIGTVSYPRQSRGFVVSRSKRLNMWAA
jgi:hypothetical protein